MFDETITINGTREQVFVQDLVEGIDVPNSKTLLDIWKGFSAEIGAIAVLGVVEISRKMRMGHWKIGGYEVFLDEKIGRDSGYMDVRVTCDGD